MVLLSHSYMTTGKTIALTIGTFAGKVMSLTWGWGGRVNSPKISLEGFSESLIYVNVTRKKMSPEKKIEDGKHTEHNKENT